jgi:vacuolar protein sorting-associated protein 13A/C
LNFELKKNAMMSPLSDVVDAAPPPPATSISICSEQNLEITVSKSCLEVLTNLSKAFRLAVKEGPKVKELEGSPYQIVNQTGIKVVLLLKDTNFTVALIFPIIDLLAKFPYGRLTMNTEAVLTWSK